MSDLIWLSTEQMSQISSCFPLSHGVPPRRRSAHRQRDHLRHPQRPALARCACRVQTSEDDLQPLRWRRLGVFNAIFATLAAKGGEPDQLMIDATHLKAHRTAASLLKRGGARQGPRPAKQVGVASGGCSPTYRAHTRAA